MKSLQNLFRFGPGPSSSHTIGPFLAAKSFSKSLPSEPKRIEVIFQGSLAYTGEGHHSAQAVRDAFTPIQSDFAFDKDTKPKHPLTMIFTAVYDKERVIKTYYSLGGGELHSDDDQSVNEKEVYPFASLQEIYEYMEKEKITQFRDFCLRFEDFSIDNYLLRIVKRMLSSVRRGLQQSGRIPADNNPRLNVNRSAKGIYEKAINLHSTEDRRTLLLTSYAYAVAEGSACGELVVTAPTCGSSGVLPAVLYYCHTQMRIPLTRLRDALYAAGIIGNLVKQNASIAGSVAGCQAEIGTASCMAAAALCSIFGLSKEQIEYAAEASMEHFLGLSCDPVDGYVIIPCIERNGIAAIRALTCFLYARYVQPVRKNKVNFDDVVNAMKITGESLSSDYKETALGGLAALLGKKKC